jgi:hypothetical protein
VAKVTDVNKEETVTKTVYTPVTSVTKVTDAKKVEPITTESAPTLSLTDDKNTEPFLRVPISSDVSSNRVEISPVAASEVNVYLLKIMLWYYFTNFGNYIAASYWTK